MRNNNYMSVNTISSPEFINLEPLDINPLMSKCEIKVLYVGKNDNGTMMDEDTVRKMAKTLRGAPIVGYYREEKEDFRDHGDQVTIDGDGVHFKSLTKPYGFVAPNARVWFQDFEETSRKTSERVIRKYLMTEGYLWTGQYEEAQSIIDNGKGQSMELDNTHDEYAVRGMWDANMEYFIINDATFSKLCILGDDVEPCFEGAEITAPEISTSFSLDKKFANTLYSMMKELQETLKGGTKVEKEKLENIALQYEDASDDADTSVEESTTTAADSTEGDVTETNSTDGNSTENESSIDAQDEDTSAGTDTVDSVSVSQEDIDSIAAKKNTFAKEEKEESDEKEDESSEDSKQAEEEDASAKKEDEEKKEDDKKKYELLESENATLKSQYEELKKEVISLREFKLDIENKAKDKLINEDFYMLSEEDKKEIVDNKDKYSLDEIKSKLAVICFDKKINYTIKEENANDFVSGTTFNISSVNNEEPAWLRAVDENNR